MRINQLREFMLDLDEDERFEMKARDGRVLISTIKLFVGNLDHQAHISLSGIYISQESPSKKGSPRSYWQSQTPSGWDLRYDNPDTEMLWQILAKLNVERKDSMSLEQFLADPNPVG